MRVSLLSFHLIITFLTACSVTVGNPFNEPGSNGQTVPNYDDEKYVVDEAFDGAYLACTKPTVATTEDSRSIVGCGFVAENGKDTIKIKDAVDSWEITLKSSETVKVETFEQNIDEYPIHINMSGSVDDVNKFTEGLALSFDLTKAEETSNVSIRFQELNSDGSVATETIEGVDLPDARLASTAVAGTDNNGNLQLGLTFRDSSTHEKLDISAVTMDWEMTLADGKTANYPDSVTSSDGQTVISIEKDSSSVYHMIVTVASPDADTAKDELRDMKLRVLINGKTYYAASVAENFEFYSGSKRYFLRETLNLTYEDALEYCQDQNASLMKADSSELNDLINDYVSTGYGSVWIGLDDLGGDDTFHWIDGSNVTYNNYKDNPPSTEYNGKEARCVMMSEYVKKWVTRPCTGFKKSFYCEQEI